MTGLECNSMVSLTDPDGDIPVHTCLIAFDRCSQIPQMPLTLCNFSPDSGYVRLCHQYFRAASLVKRGGKYD